MSHVAEHRTADAIVALERAAAADAAVAAGSDGALGQKLRKTLANLHRQAATTHIAAGQLAPAATHLRVAIRYDPREQSAREQLQRIVAHANEAYLRGYVAKDIDEEAAREAFHAVVEVLPASDATAQKARRWLAHLDGDAAEED